MTTLPRTLELLRRGIDDGTHIGFQLYVSRRGEVLTDVAEGRARAAIDGQDRDVPMTPQTLMPWLSCSKPATAVAVAQLWEQDRLGLDDPAGRHLPAFAQGGKEGITLRHVLTHTAGLGKIAINWPHDDWGALLDAICQAPLPEGFTPGQDAMYDPTNGWFVLGEIVRRLTGEPVEQYVKQHVFEPLGMTDCHLAMPRAQAEAYGDRMGRLYVTRRDTLEPRPESMPYLERCHRCAPGATGRGPARELARLFEMLVGGGERQDVRLLRPQTVEAITARHRVGKFDLAFRHTIDWGLGFVCDSKQYHDTKPQPYGFGPHCSPRAFGHGGNQSSIAFADPEHALVVCWICNGMPGPAGHDRRNWAINGAVYEDLGLV